VEFLKNKISLIEKQMKSRLEEITETFQHSGNKGTSLEAVFREFLLQYLPRRLDIGNGEIVSINGLDTNLKTGLKNGVRTGVPFRKLIS
jgi:hypothetical protein